MPQNDAGIRTEPPPSEPSASGPTPLATAAAPPPLEPPGVSAGSQGLRVTPKSGFSVTALWPNSDVFVLPRTPAPAARRRATGSASSAGTCSANRREPPVVVRPRVASRSLIDRGTPWSAPSGSPFTTAISAPRAAARAASAATRQNAFSAGSTASSRARTASVTSTGDTSFFRTRSRSSSADRQISSASLIARIVSFRVVGASVLDLRWRPDGALERAWVRIPDGSWLGVEPAATREAPWGLSDRLWHARAAPGPGAAIPADAVALTVLEALDWSRIDRIPVLAEPGRLPPGGGAAPPHPPPTPPPP